MNFLVAHADGTEQPSPEVTPVHGGVLVLLGPRSWISGWLLSGTVIAPRFQTRGVRQYSRFERTVLVVPSKA